MVLGVGFWSQAPFNHRSISFLTCRVVQCDENWPTCTPCAKSRCPCSGPPIPIDAADSDASSTISLPSSPSSSSRLLSHYELPEGSSLIRVRLNVHHPRSYPTTIADRVASRLVAYLEKGSLFDASLAVDYLKLLPTRLDSSNALRDAVALFCGCWGGFRRAPATQLLVDPRARVKALRSLQRALADENSMFASETLAAAALMERVAVLFDNRGDEELVAHVRGISSLMVHRGPPNIEDELDLALAFANLGTLVCPPQIPVILSTILTDIDLDKILAHLGRQKLLPQLTLA